MPDVRYMQKKLQYYILGFVKTPCGLPIRVGLCLFPDGRHHLINEELLGSSRQLQSIYDTVEDMVQWLSCCRGFLFQMHDARFIVLGVF